MKWPILCFLYLTFITDIVYSRTFQDKFIRTDSTIQFTSNDSADTASNYPLAELHDAETDSVPAKDSTHAYVYPAEDTSSRSAILNTSAWRNATKDLSYPKANEINTNLPNIRMPWIKYIIYGIGIAVTIFLLYNIVVLALKPANKKVRENIDVSEIEIEKLPVENLESMLKAAIETGDLRNAVRFSYLVTLKNLSEKKLIVRTRDKTNFDYITELSSHPMVNIFRDISRAFEYTWYGEIIPVMDEYKKFETK
jgi:hypothetical protein